MRVTVSSGEEVVAPDDSQYTGKPSCPIGEEVDVLRLALNSRRHAAIVQPDRDQKDFVERHIVGEIERVVDFCLESAPFFDRLARKAGDEKIRAGDGVFNPMRPVLAREELAPIQPDGKTKRRQVVEQPFRREAVLRSISDEYTGIRRMLKGKITAFVASEDS